MALRRKINLKESSEQVHGRLLLFKQKQVNCPNVADESDKPFAGY
jgi:hypothetical protein